MSRARTGQAALVESPGAPFVVRDVDVEAPRAGEVLVRLRAAGLCHTDLASSGRWPERLSPMVFGHEGAGVVEEAGPSVHGLVPGDAVVLTFDSCGRCLPCQDGQPAYCVKSLALNSSGTRRDGSTPLSRGGAPVYGCFFGQSSFATYAVANERNTVKIPSDLPFSTAAPLGCGFQTGAGAILNVLRPKPGEALVVVGVGGVGMSALLAAVSAGCSPVVAVDPVADRRELAAELGAAATLDPAGVDDVAAALRDLTGGGARHAVDTSARPEMIRAAAAALRPLGTLALLGVGGTLSLPAMPLILGGVTVRGVTEGDSNPHQFIPQLVELHRQGRFPVERLVTEFDFADIEKAAAAMREGAVVKPVLVFPEG